ncbi:MAG TPA: helix-hairpin-helix domain-containing protein [Anaeromyxobacteraceae bacterium]|nr:helix-hairpin-helix domain-containing protein [Anaeromyxobacteraceae bacterium]
MNRRRRAAALALAAVALAMSSPALAKQPMGPTERVDVNRATVAELMRLPGVGAKRAQAIVVQRARRPFQRPEDLLGVKGIRPGWLSRVRAHLTTGAAAARGDDSTGWGDAARR